MRETRERLQFEIKAFIDKHIEDVDPHYNEDRIIKETEKPETEIDEIIKKNLKRKLKRNSIQEIERLSDFVSLN